MSLITNHITPSVDTQKWQPPSKLSSQLDIVVASVLNDVISKTTIICRDAMVDILPAATWDGRKLI